MSRGRLLIFVLGLPVCGAAAFYVGRGAAGGASLREHQARHKWLHGAPAGALRAEQQFTRRVARLDATVRADQARLASLLGDPCATGDQILEQAERVAGSHTRLMEAVGNHLVELREVLPGQQRRELMGACANSLRGRVQRRYRWRGGAQDQSAERRGGRGYGRGRGRRYRGGQEVGDTLASRLELTDEQALLAQRYDPNFEEDCTGLKDRLREAHSGLVEAFESTDVGNGDLLERIGDLIEAHNALERRVARYVVLLRPHLSREQQERLSGLCGGGRRYQGGPSASSRSHDVHDIGTVGFFRQLLGHSV